MAVTRYLSPRQVREQYFPLIGKDKMYAIFHSKAFPSFHLNGRMYVDERKLIQYMDARVGKGMRI